MDLIDKLFSQGGSSETSNPLVSNQIDSFNEFIDKKLRQIIYGFNSVQVFQSFINGEFKQKISVNVLNPSLVKPTFNRLDGTQMLMTPHLARMNNLTYASTLYVDIHVISEEINNDGVVERIENTINTVCLGKIPIMVRSKACVLQQMPGIGEGDGKNECRYDPGGYWIINGNEKAVISQDRISGNFTHVFANASNPDGMTAEIRSTQDGVFLPPKTTTLHLSGKPNHLGRVIKLNTSFLKNEVPLFVMFRALGIINDKEIIQHIVLNHSDEANIKIIDELSASIEDASEIYTQDAALTYLVRLLGITGTPREYLENIEQAKSVLLNVIKNDFLPHVGQCFHKKALYIGFMTRKLLRIYLGYQPSDNRDSYICKRIDTPGVLFGNLFRQCYGKMIKEMRKMVQHELRLWRANQQLKTTVITASNVHRFFKQTTMESGLRYALSTGNWGVKTLGSFNNIRQGVAQVLNRMSYLSTLSHLRRINTPMENKGKLVQPRKLDITQFGMTCPAETPEGSSVGLVKNMAMSTTITTTTSSSYVRRLLTDLDTQEYENIVNNKADVATLYKFLNEMGSDKSVMVFVNGDLIGYHKDPPTIFNTLKHLKRKGTIPPPTSITWDIRLRSLCINTDAGRMSRPLLIVDNGNSLRSYDKNKSFKELIAPLTEDVEGVIEYLDVDEIDKAMIAMTPRDLTKGNKGEAKQPNFTHCEIHPSLMNGILAANIPFSDHNQAPRNCYQAAMGKQAVGIYMSNFNNRCDTMAHVLNYSQKALARTHLSKITHSEELTGGINAIVAIMTYTGFNQEDSVMINQSAIDRGLFHSTYYKTMRDQCNKNHSTGEEEKFCIPDQSTTTSLKSFNYSKLGPDGFVPPNTRVEGGDILVGKVMPHVVGGHSMPRDSSVHIKQNEGGIVDNNYQGVNSDGYRFCKVRLREHRIPEIGDKFSSKHGQKGSMGMTYKEHDMPFTKDGIVPDIIINPHAIPSRMTIAHLMECLMGKAGCYIGAQGDATPYNGCTVEDIASALDGSGYERYGNEIMYDGRTGLQIHTEIFIGPTYYQRLKHQVVDKQHSRCGGPVVLLTRQPAEGRSRCGGLRFGEMECNAAISHGISTFTKERFLECSDMYRVFICAKCGLLAIANPEKNIYKCTTCKNTADFRQIRVPFALKLLFQELEAMSIAPRIIV